MLMTKDSERTFIVDSGASFHMVSYEFLRPEERKFVRKLENPVKLDTAAGPTEAGFVTTLYVKSLDIMIIALVMTVRVPAVLSMGRLCTDEGCRVCWEPWTATPAIVGPKGGAPLDCGCQTLVPCIQVARGDIQIMNPDEEDMEDSATQNPNLECGALPSWVL